MTTEPARGLIGIVTPCFNEAGNVEELVERIAAVMATVPYDYEHILIDNASTDGTVDVLRRIAARDRHVKVIVNARNFGHIRSPFHAIRQSSGDAVILMAADLQDPPELIPAFLDKWEKGFKAVFAVKTGTDEGRLMSAVRRLYYRLSSDISEVPIVRNATGAGLIDRAIVDILRTIDDPYPYYRGLIAEIGFPIAEVGFRQPVRTSGRSSNNLYSLYDIGMLGITSYSRLPLRLAVAVGFAAASLSLLVAFGFFIAKLVFWNSFQLGLAPLLIGLFFFSSIQLFSIGILGEYVVSINTQVRKRPIVVEAERINFE
ncbi:MAG: glycosyltransferase family 2 protein [Acidimicrobiia bacterium]|nr:glycosyltransferase family 2 protein [Acidimicrobiia bacterium]